MLTCPRCRADIPLEDLNVSTDIALCRRCDETYSFAELSRGGAPVDVDTARPPDGAWYESQGNEFEVGATSRSWMAVILVPFTALWAGGSLWAIYGSQIAKGTFDPTSSLVGIPFRLATALSVERDSHGAHLADQVAPKRFPPAHHRARGAEADSFRQPALGSAPGLHAGRAPPPPVRSWLAAHGKAVEPGHAPFDSVLGHVAPPRPPGPSQPMCRDARLYVNEAQAAIGETLTRAS